MPAAPAGPSRPSLESLIASASADGWRILDLHQSESGHWHANIGTAHLLGGIGSGPTAAEALAQALANASTETVESYHLRTQTTFETTALAKLFHRPTIKVERRI